jgi:hypothetical protein
MKINNAGKLLILVLAISIGVGFLYTKEGDTLNILGTGLFALFLIVVIVIGLIVNQVDKWINKDEK